MNRRHFLGALALPAFAKPAALRVNAARLREHLEALSVFGRPSGGTFADGVSRVAYSDADVAGRRYTMGLMEAAGLKPRIDAAGNIFARRAGTEPAQAPVLFGSHIDSVPSGGNFDGDLGSLGAIEVIQTIQEAGLVTRRPLEVVVWCNEEGVAYNNGLSGSRAAAGHLDPGELDLVWNGVKKSDAVRKLGGNPDRIAEARLHPGYFHCYLELHIEQGGTLDQAGIPIGVVEGIVSIDRYEVEIRGFANHAGTTPMPQRRDALLAASYLIVAVNQIVRRDPGPQVGTIGQISVSPNAPNVVPGLVRLTIELRDLSSGKIADLAKQIMARAREIAADTSTGIDIRPAAHHDAALAAPEVQKSIEAACTTLGLKSRRLPSGAGHDAQMMATLGPMGMIFVPSVDGISHAPKEFSRWEDCARGAGVLLETVLAWAG
ncbi:MAG TPA: Zn-dependent hydrolase [Bryobacteraceae bacterium]|jgi:N-carbamoyl-L-amino-acid hydrolase|nr:Zn-dependent hydrolase [Bryobacteraceae bacterium]